MYRIGRDNSGFYYDPNLDPVVLIRPGQRVLFETLDARSGAMFSHPVGELLELPAPIVGRGNPVTGPLGIIGAQPGDALVVVLEKINIGRLGWVGARADSYMRSTSDMTRPQGRVCSIESGQVFFSPSVHFPVQPMVGCLGTASADRAPSTTPGRYGGNLDHAVLREGARVYLPIEAPLGRLYVGDVHARQGDGEVSSIAVEVAAEVTLAIELERCFQLTWPWVETADTVAVMTSAATFEEARREAVDTMLSVVQDRLNMDPGEALALISAVGDLRIGQACGGMDLTLRLEMPRMLGLGYDVDDMEVSRVGPNA